ncbi:type VI secretion system ATPase TssH [Acinetobacter faecalis]|uniref:type VI secretion system ATPase TssH n=1 Tax=Acinetobacter faecalis TaxID=2665161 RepID=UPI002A91598F|nr:type VI secretion system ATPase TssH [Acinetobacter faecalis]MDY6450952.1 type VI secretion system ATPase TssH [Acinetobacter faecalis]
MSSVSRSALFTKLNKTLYKSIENAYFFAKIRENKFVEIVHWLYQLEQQNDGDLFFIEKYFSINHDVLMNDFAAYLDQLKAGYEINDFSDDVVTLIEESWLYTSLKFNQHHIRSGYLIYTLLVSTQFKNTLFNISQEFRKINADQLADEYLNICKDSTENLVSDLVDSSIQGMPSTTSALEKYGTNLTQQAREGLLDPVTARDSEILQMINILLRKRQNNPLLTGEAGVGKTAVVEGLALKIAEQQVPPALSHVELYLLDIGALKAGASISGEFENRLKAIMQEVKNSPKPIILFIDEIHTLIGAGGASGTGDAANLLKPALARGELRTIGATTWAEYKKYFEKDAALTRRFQTIQVAEPSEKIAASMLRALVPRLEAHHQVKILDEAIVAAVKLSKRYIPARQLPDKAIGLLDTACARVSVSLTAIPQLLNEIEQKQISLRKEQQDLLKQQDFGHSIKENALDEINQKIEQYSKEHDLLSQQYEKEKKLVDQLIQIREKLHAPSDLSQMRSEADVQVLKDEQTRLLMELREVQNAHALVFSVVDSELIAQVVADWTGIPVGKMVGDEVQKVLELSSVLNERVIGQAHGLDAISKRIQTSRAMLDDPNKPIGVFMLAGPSGVGKTETALALADTIYGGEHNLITINMSEYQEAHTVSTLKGAPPGYVGYGEGGVLTEAVRRKPYSVVLLDEVEKAHPDVHEIFFQVFDKGWMEDGEGRYIDFKNTVIILTTNVGSELIMDLCQDEELKPTVEGLQKALREPLLKVFPAALLGRIQTIPYYPLSNEMLEKIVELQLNRIVKRIQHNHEIILSYTPDVLSYVVARCTELESGGRMIDAILTNSILPEISLKLLSNMSDEQKIKQISIEVENDQLSYQYHNKA